MDADISSATAAEQQRGVLQQTLSLGAMLLIFGSLLSWLLASKLTQPLRRFSDAVQRFSWSEFDLRMPVCTRDELGNLATATGVC